MKSNEPAPERLSVDRRSFFRQLMLRGLDRVEEAGQAAVRRWTQTVGLLNLPPATTDEGVMAHRRPEAAPPRQYLRPPGAVSEDRFADLCSRCDECVKVCPAHCIIRQDGHAGGLPYIVARSSPCVLCDDLSCMKACPTGALERLAVASLVTMGLAVIDQHRCLRRPTGADDHPAAIGEDCRICATQCPIGETAIGLDANGFIEVRNGCTGCGVCEHLCPTEPASIVVRRREGI